MDPPFEDYLDKEAVQRGLKLKKLIQGVLRINQRKYEDAYVDDPEGGGDYYVSGVHRRNRALDGDVVVLEVLPPDKWLSISKAETASATDGPTDGPCSTATLVDRLYNVPDSMKVGREGEEEVEGEAHRRYQRELMKYRRTTKVVYIVEKGHSRSFAGHLKAFDKDKGLALLSPKDSKIPRVVIPIADCPPDYVQEHQKYKNTLFIGRILSWERDSPFARGELMRSVGEAGEIEPETESFLVENDIEFGEFLPEALECLPRQTPWTIPQEEVGRRRDFRKECVFTIDPETARLAKGLKGQRESKGTLRLNQPKLKFTLNKETGLPSGCDVYVQRESNRLIEEFMLLANMAVAHKIWRTFRDRALLRRHPSPKEKSAQFLVQKFASLGIPLDVSTAASIQSSLDQYLGTTSDEETNSMQKMVLVSNCSKIMELARYFCTGTVEKEAEFKHYALNVPRYTHFTSPIRRYADIVVHRQLTSSLGEGPDFTMIMEEVESQAHHCNKKKKSAKTVEELSMQMFFAIFIKECGGIRGRGIVVQVLDKAIDVLVQDYGVIKRVYCEYLVLEKYEAHQKKGESAVCSITLEWPGEGGGPTIKQDLSTMSVVDVELTSGQKPLQFDAKILRPPQPVLEST
ncbi:DIS3-like exonuclease 2 [Geodia barretti]|uniref:DIS3-like exonuclease 2 n=1 Tax=Geodia barretti TaxID=519541 RepID=A0AA35TYE5_GEOBA|nr:DIS3-like exonuclease 2 [Geodia barretti]